MREPHSIMICYLNFNFIVEQILLVSREDVKEFKHPKDWICECDFPGHFNFGPFESYTRIS